MILLKLTSAQLSNQRAYKLNGSREIPDKKGQRRTHAVLASSPMKAAPKEFRMSTTGDSEPGMLKQRR